MANSGRVGEASRASSEMRARSELIEIAVEFNELRASLTHDAPALVPPLPYEKRPVTARKVTLSVVSRSRAESVRTRFQSTS